MRASDVMTRAVVTVRPDTTIAEAAALLRERGITSMPVLDEDDRVIGIVSEVDLLRDRMPHDPRSHLRPVLPDRREPGNAVGDVMQEPVICMSASADVADLAAVMLENNVRAVPITDAGRLLGIVSRRDLLRTLVRNDADVRADVAQLIDEFLGETDRWKVEAEDGVVTITGAFDDPAQQKTVSVLARAVPGVLRVNTLMRRFR